MAKIGKEGEDSKLNPDGFDPYGVYSKTEFISQLKHISGQFPDDEAVQDYISSILPWAEGVAPNANIGFLLSNEDGLVHPVVIPKT